MGLLLDLRIDGDPEGWARDARLGYLIAVRSATEAASARIKEMLRDDTASKLKGPRIRTTWQDVIHPGKGFAYNPSATIFSVADDLMEAHGFGMTIGPKRTRFLVFPFPGAPTERIRPFKGRNVVAAAIGRFGKMDLVPVRSRPGSYLLKLQSTGRPMFVVTRQVTLKRRLSWPAIFAHGERLFPREIEKFLSSTYSIGRQRPRRRS